MWIFGVKKAVEYFKQGFMGLISRTMKDSGAEGDLNCGDLAQEVSERKNMSM